MSLDCATCGEGSPWSRLGLDTEGWDFTVALAGNPNTGKSTIFNALTGLRQHTGNWPGKTVARAEGGFSYGEHGYKLVDLPGTYSLLSATPDEEVARDFILFGRPDVTVVVADASRLERNLNLTLQVLQITNRAVLCLNLMDEARASGIELDTRGLARDLGIPVVPCAARQMEGVPDLLRVIAEVAGGKLACSPRPLEVRDPALAAALEQIRGELNTRFPDLPHKTWIALRLLEGDRHIVEAVRDGTIGRLAEDNPEPTLAS
jgi:ferrous iron transport protein B